MPLAKYITEFQALDRKAQATAVIRGEYSKDQLTKLYKYATSATVRDTIDDMINHGEFDLNEQEQFKYHGPDYQDKTVAGKEYRFDHLQKRIKVRSGPQAWKLYFKHDDFAVLESAWFTIDKQVEEVTPMPIEKAKSDTVSHLTDVFMDDFRAEIDEFNATGKRFAELTLRIGMRLEFVKAQLPHGQLNKWIEQNVDLSIRHTQRCRKLAQVFIEAQKINAGEAFALVDPANSQKELAKKLDQMAFDFIADRTQAELFAEYGIQVREAKKLGGARESTKEDEQLSPGETAAHLAAKGVVGELQDKLFRFCLSEPTMQIQHLKLHELEKLHGTLLDSTREVAALIKQG